MSELKPGDRVAVNDPALSALRDIMRQAGHDPKPNHTGVIERIDGDTAYINFDDGVMAPYSLDECSKLSPEGRPVEPVARQIVFRGAIGEVRFSAGGDRGAFVDQLGFEAVSSHPDRADGFARVHLTSGEDEESPWYGDEPVIRLERHQIEQTITALTLCLEAIDGYVGQ